MAIKRGGSVDRESAAWAAAGRSCAWALCARGIGARGAALRCFGQCGRRSRRLGAGCAGGKDAPDLDGLAARSLLILQHERASVRPVINATGVLLHTGLGRAPLAFEAIEAIEAVARGYCSLELDLEDGERGRRTSGIERLVCELTGAEAATAVNNNAGATVLAQGPGGRARGDCVARGARRNRWVVPAAGDPRGFGTKLREVGTTNKTRLSDYKQAIGPETAAILRVHRSNFQIVGFTETPKLSELVKLAHERGIWAIDDIGSGASIAKGRLHSHRTSRRPWRASRRGPTRCCFPGTSFWVGRSAV